MIKLLVVDDDNIVRLGVSSILDQYPDFKVIDNRASGEETIEYLNQPNEIDVVILDLNMPGIGGYETTRRLHIKYPNLPIVILTVTKSESLPQYLLKAGATAYMTKGCEPDELKLAIIKAYNKQNHISQELALAMALSLQSFDKSPFEKLSEREMQIIVMILHGMKSVDIAETIHVSPKTVCTHRTRAFEKLNIESDMDLFRLALQYNLIEM